MSGWWEFGDGPLPARDGIAARSERGAIGESWWSRRFVEALDAVTDTSRVSRGRSYARSGQVMELKVEPGGVTARVQGSDPRPYRVRVGLRPFTEEEWGRVEEAMAGEAIFLAALLAGEMPHDVERAFQAAGLSLFPATPDELSTACTCPDPVNPCKHVAASFYILAEAFDRDPFLVLAWRGRSRDDLLARLRELRGAAPAAEAAPAPPPPDFWKAGPELASLRFDPRAPETPDAVLRQLGPLPPEAGGEKTQQALARAYAHFTAAAERRAFSDDPEEG